jgi:uncharacterized membrane protein YfcA
MPTDPLFYAIAIPAVILLGLAKGGFVGVSAIAMPMLALVISPVRAAAIVLPILLVQDLVSVWSFRRTWDRKVVGVMLVGAPVGILLGYLLAARVSANAVMGVLGGISILFGLQRIWAERGGDVVAPANAPAWVGSLCGAGSAFTSQVAHAGSPPFQIYVLPRRLPRDELVGTTAIFFALVNWMKVPAYAALGQFTRPNLLTSASLLPVAIASTIAGVFLVRKVDPKKFYLATYVLMIVVGAKLVWDALI